MGDIFRTDRMSTNAAMRCLGDRCSLLSVGHSVLVWAVLDCWVFLRNLDNWVFQPRSLDISAKFGYFWRVWIFLESLDISAEFCGVSNLSARRALNISCGQTWFLCLCEQCFGQMFLQKSVGMATMADRR